MISPGTKIALRYRVGDLLGRGGMASVYRAHHLTLTTDVALKVLDDHFRSDSVLARRFEREARHCAQLNNPHCIRIFDHGVSVDGYRFLAMELIDGPTLRDYANQHGPLAPREALRIIHGALEGLVHAHSKGILHRDLKPENIMIDSDDRVVVIDFGLSQIAMDLPLTEAGKCIGSPSYLAPERVLSTACDERADLYSMGIILYELLAGRRPFVGTTPLAIATAQVQTQPPPLPRLRPDIPLPIAQFVDRCLAKRPDDRFDSAQAMLTTLKRLALTIDKGTIQSKSLKPEAIYSYPARTNELSASELIHMGPPPIPLTAPVTSSAPPQWWRRAWRKLWTSRDNRASAIETRKLSTKG